MLPTPHLAYLQYLENYLNMAMLLSNDHSIFRKTMGNHTNEYESALQSTMFGSATGHSTPGGS